MRKRAREVGLDAVVVDVAGLDLQGCCTIGGLVDMNVGVYVDEGEGQRQRPEAGETDCYEAMSWTKDEEAEGLHSRDP